MEEEKRMRNLKVKAVAEQERGCIMGSLPILQRQPETLSSTFQTWAPRRAVWGCILKGPQPKVTFCHGQVSLSRGWRRSTEQKGGVGGVWGASKARQQHCPSQGCCHTGGRGKSSSLPTEGLHNINWRNTDKQEKKAYEIYLTCMEETHRTVITQ